MFKQAIIHYPNDENARKFIHKEIAAFRCNAIVKYVESLNLNSRQVETLYESLADDINTIKQRTA